MSVGKLMLMDLPQSKILFSLLHSGMSGTRLAKTKLMDYSADMLHDLLKMSAKHDVVHLLVLGLKQNGLISGKNSEIEKYIYKAVYRYEQLRLEHDMLCKILEREHIPFLPLKGSVICRYYPEPWMRTSCDIDILVKNDVDEVKSLLIDKYSYTYYAKGTHDISLFSKSGIHIELHYALVEIEVANEASDVLKNVWKKTVVREGFEYYHEMPDDLFYFYHIAHMAKHFEHGGCGIRPFIDLWILDHIDGVDIKKRDILLGEGNLLTFANVARKLSSIWFDDEQHDAVTQQMEEFILRGGVYGTITNRIIVQQQKKGGRIKYALSKIFIPYDVIKFHYPILHKHRWLTPIMEVRRWCKLIFCGHLKRTSRELMYNSSISDTEAANAQKFLSDIGL